MSDNRAYHQVTEWGHPRDRVNTVNGPVSYEHWLQLEVLRNAEKWRETWIEVNKEGMVALFGWACDYLTIDGEDPKE